MKRYIPIYTLFLLIFFDYLGKAQNNATLQKKKTINTSQQETDLPSFDPYFTESTRINSFSGPKSITRNILQDSKGNIWLATWEGILEYNPNHLPTGKGGFTNHTNQEGLKRFHVFSLLEDTKGNIWFGTIGAGVYLYDGQSFINFTTKEGLVHNGIGCFLEDKAGNIWIGTQGGVSKYDGQSFTNFTIKEGLINEDINSIIEDSNGQLWFGTRGNACVFDGTTFTQFNNQEGRPFVNVRSIIEDENGNIWLGGNDGLWRYNGTTFTTFTSNFVGYIYEDEASNIWTSSAASNNGNSHSWVLSRYDIAALQKGDTRPVQIKTEEGMFFGITEDKEGNIWLGTLNGVYRYDCISFESFK